MAQLIAKIVGAAFLITGILGFVTGHSHLMGIFGVNVPHNVVHLLSGILGLFLGFAGEGAARAYCLGFGAVYGLVTLLGFLGVDSVVNLLNINQADNFLHLGVTAGLLFGGLASKSPTASAHSAKA